MVRYHFNVKDGHTTPDLEGTEFPTLGHARREAIRLAGYLLMTQPKEFWNGHPWYVEVTQSDEKVLFRLRFVSENVAVPEGHNPFDERALSPKA